MSARVVRSYDERMRGYARVLDARDPATAPDRLRVLATDGIRPVRYYTARNQCTPGDVLDALTDDEDSSVRWVALLNPQTPEEPLRRAAEAEAEKYGDRWFIVRHVVAHHPRASDDLRRQLVSAGACTHSGTCRRAT